MPRPKQHANNAARQAAYRARHPERKRPRQDRLARLALNLHYTIQEAIDQHVFPLPAEILGARADETLRHLLYYLDPDPDPVVYFGLEGMPRAYPQQPPGGSGPQANDSH